MTDLLDRIISLVASGNFRISEHGYDELSEEELSARELVSGIAQATLVEEYPEYPKGPCLLVLQRTSEGDPAHVVWGIPRGYTEPVVLVTAYRPDPGKWAGDFKTRRSL